MAWGRWCAQRGIEPLEVSYEELSSDPVAGQVLGFRGLSLPEGQALRASNRVMADGGSADWAARFRAEAADRGVEHGCRGW